MKFVYLRNLKHGNLMSTRSELDLFLRVALGALAYKTASVRYLGKTPVTEQTPDGHLVQVWKGTPISAAMHREIGDAQMRSRLPKVLDGAEWDVGDALDAFFTALSHYAVSEGAAFVLRPAGEGAAVLTGSGAVLSLGEDVAALTAELRALVSWVVSGNLVSRKEDGVPVWYFAVPESVVRDCQVVLDRVSGRPGATVARPMETVAGVKDAT